MIIYTNFMPSRFNGWTIGPLVLIRPSHKNDKQIHAHELTHVAQWKRTWGLMWILAISKDYQARLEAEAYRAQIKEGMPLIKAVDCMVSLYRFDISRARAVALLTNDKF